MALRMLVLAISHAKDPGMRKQDNKDRPARTEPNLNFEARD